MLNAQGMQCKGLFQWQQGWGSSAVASPPGLLPRPAPVSGCRRSAESGRIQWPVPTHPGHVVLKRKPSLQPLAALSSAAAAAVAPAPGGILPGIFPVSGPFGVWSCLVVAGALGLWMEKNTRIGRELSGALMATLIGMVFANIGVLPPGAPELNVVYKYILPLAIPLLLYAANLKRMLTETGRLLPAFFLGSATTVMGSLAAWILLPLGRFLGEAGWQVVSALTARHIGGAVNYMAVSETLKLSPSVFGAGLAADDLILTFYFSALYALAKDIPPEQPAPVPSSSSKESSNSSSPGSSDSSSGGITGSLSAGTSSSSPTSGSQSSSPGSHGGGHAGPPKVITVHEGLQALALSAVICHAGMTLAKTVALPEQSIMAVTLLTVVLATSVPTRLAPLIPAAEGIAQILMQIFYATIGASANVGLVVQTAPILFLYSAIALAGHLGLMLGLGKLLGFSRRDLLIASNANIGGPTTVAGMAAAKGWNSQVLPGILTSTLGYAIGTFIGLLLGQQVLQKLG